ncbi:hypothetical protein SASPL_156742 [Salvia splendens]|uniref:Uncharacterized protein n=1 Tax=Salvia splendens TaxID=180675 RepID=A0A8X8VW57_SALSN|nr:hypothetical protein SASPL_156742 [Salvia splendens]
MAAATGFMPPPFDVQILRCQKKRRLFASCCSPRNCKQRILYPALSFASSKSRFVTKQDKFFSRCTPRNTGPQFRDSPLKEINVKVLVRGFNIEDEFFSVDTGIANEEEWGISLLNDSVNESGTNEDGSTWYRESGEDLGDNGYRCRWTRMGGRSADTTSEWKETWWEKSDWTGYKELGTPTKLCFPICYYVLRSLEGMQKGILGGKHGEKFFIKMNEVSVFYLRYSCLAIFINLARIERSAQKQAKSGTEKAGWWEKYDAKGWTEKGAHKYGRLNEQSWWEKWGEHYDGSGSILKWTDKWAETELGTKWGDKWEEKFFAGIGSRQGETWSVSPSNDSKLLIYCYLLGMELLSRFFTCHFFPHQTLGWSRTWGEEHFGNGKVHKYGKSTTGESWDIVVDEETYYEADPHYGWADVVGDSNQLLSIQPRERPPGVFPTLDFGSSPPADNDETSSDQE